MQTNPPLVDEHVTLETPAAIGKDRATGTRDSSAATPIMGGLLLTYLEGYLPNNVHTADE